MKYVVLTGIYAIKACTQWLIGKIRYPLSTLVDDGNNSSTTNLYLCPSYITMYTEIFSNGKMIFPVF